MKKPKEGRDFTIYAKNIEMENEIFCIGNNR